MREKKRGDGDIHMSFIGQIQTGCHGTDSNSLFTFFGTFLVVQHHQTDK